ncbi:hypothetical protein [uncultured Ilyobacter sp.]|uniref:hypothetical protein n=1 Tax=uncultured Ilyobacter sp. TaxID=544433 RepID=UPI0029C8AB33|nr:hypothetical protein [uncultured Ilyobacter sp.]
MNYFKNNKSLCLSISNAEQILKKEFINIKLELTLISKNINIKQTLIISEVTRSGQFFYMTFLEISDLYINTLEFDSIYYYSPGSLVFVFMDGSTLTFRPLENLNKLKILPVEK